MSHIPPNSRQRVSRVVNVGSALTAFMSLALLAGTLAPATAQPVTSAASVAAAPAAAQTVTVGAGTRTLTGTNIDRGVNALVVYRSPVTVTTTNEWGVEVTVVNGKVTVVNDRELNDSTVGTPVPAGGYVLSGHNLSADWLRTYAKVGTAVSLSGVPTTPVPTTPVTPEANQVVAVGGGQYKLSGVNIGRETNALVVYRAPLAVTPTNMWGVEVSVLNGKVTAVNDRQASASTTGTAVPAGGYILSGHHLAAEWLRTYAKVGSTVTATNATTPVPTTPVPTTPVPTTPVPTTPVTPEANQAVAVGGGQYNLSGVNIGRETNALVVYRAPVTVTTTNEWGVEVSVLNGKVTAVNDRQASASTTGTAVPAGGYILSGHNLAAEWLRTYAKVGSTVTATNATTPVPTTPVPTTPVPTTPVPTTPVPTTPTAPVGTSEPMGLPTKVQALYQMMWSGSPRLSSIPSEINVVNLAFLQGDPPSIVGWSTQGEASFIADAKMLRARGVRMVASVGGSGGHVNVGNRQGFVNGVMALNAKLPLDGLDWDLEGTGMGLSDIVWISQELKRLRGSKFAITMAPNGSDIDHYKGIAVELMKTNSLDFIGQQFYDAEVSEGAMMGRLDQLAAAGIPQSKFGVGMMVADGSNWWTVDTCISRYKAAKAKYPNIRGSYLWESGRAGTADWASRVGALIKG